MHSESVSVYLIGDLRLGGDLRLAGDRLSGGRGGLMSQMKYVCKNFPCQKCTGSPSPPTPVASLQLDLFVDDCGQEIVQAPG